MSSYDPADWYWQAEDGSLYGSRRGTIVQPEDAEFAAWAAAGGVPTRHPGHDELADVLAVYGLPYYGDLPHAIAARWDEIAALYAEQLAAGMSYGGQVLQIDEASQLRITGAAAAAGLTGSVPASGWRMADNTFLALPAAADMVQLAAAAAVAVEALRTTMWAHKDAIAALGDLAAVLAYDVSTGW